MIQYFRESPRISLLAAVAASFCFLLTPAARAQKQDQFALRPDQWRKASLATPYGLIVGGRLPLAYVTPDESSGSINKITAIDIDAYYDTYQAGYHKKDYGNMFSLMFRTTGRDVYTGWYLEVGKSTLNVLGRESQIIVGVSRSVFGAGIRGNIVYPNNPIFWSNYDVSVGSTNSDSGTVLYAYGQFGFGLRIPIATTALTAGVNVYTGFIPANRIFVGSTSDISGIAGVGFIASYALNFERE
jgi:hypothetical protein